MAGPVFSGPVEGALDAFALCHRALSTSTKPEVDLYALVKQCAATQNLESDECVRALELSGLSLDEFKAKFAAKLGYLAKKDQMTAMMKTCLELKASLNGKSAGDLHDLVEKVNYACRKALVESHMNPAQFWTKYR